MNAASEKEDGTLPGNTMGYRQTRRRSSGRGRQAGWGTLFLEERFM